MTTKQKMQVAEDAYKMSALCDFLFHKTDIEHVWSYTTNNQYLPASYYLIWQLTSKGSYGVGGKRGKPPRAKMISKGQVEWLMKTHGYAFEEMTR